MDRSSQYFHFELHVGRSRASVTVALHGELDLAGLPAFEDALSEIEARAEPKVFLDLSALSFLDCAGLRGFIEAQKRLRASGKEMTIIRGPRHVQRVFELTGLDADFTFASRSAPDHRDT